jgi:hypothetical protein
MDARGEARLVEEHLDELGLAREVRMKPLDRDEPLEARHAGETSEEDRRHTAARELGDELEAVEAFAFSVVGEELGQRSPSSDIESLFGVVGDNAWVEVGCCRSSRACRRFTGLFRQLAGRRGRTCIGLRKVSRMKTNRTLLVASTFSFVAVAALAVGLCGPRLAHADPPGNADGLGTWEGSGTTTDVDGQLVGPFTVNLTRTARAGGVRSDGRIRTSDGKEIAFWQETVGSKDKFRITSSLGTGGGCCFANGMCQSLEQGPDGRAFATTLAKDGTGKLRVLVTELKDGHAVRFYAQTLAQKP